MSLMYFAWLYAFQNPCLPSPCSIFLGVPFWVVTQTPLPKNPIHTYFGGHVVGPPRKRLCVFDSVLCTAELVQNISLKVSFLGHLDWHSHLVWAGGLLFGPPNPYLTKLGG